MANRDEDSRWTAGDQHFLGLDLELPAPFPTKNGRLGFFAK
jgi:hypothetical protein